MKCEWCNSDFRPDHWSSRYCSDGCRRKARAAAKARCDAKNKSEPAVKVILDPDPIGGYNPGATISRLCVEYGLQFGTFTPGTEISDGRVTWQIVGAPGVPQRKVRV